MGAFTQKSPGLSALSFPHLGDKKPERRIITFNSASQIRVLKARKLSDSRQLSTGFFCQSFLPPRGRLLKIYQRPPKSQENSLLFFYRINLPHKYRRFELFQPSPGYFIFVQSQIMPQLVQKSRPHFLPKNHLISFGKIPKIFQKQNNLRRQRHIPFIGKFRSGEQSQRVRLNSVSLQIRIRLALERHRQFFRPLPQRLRQRRNRHFDFRQCRRAQFFPVQVHRANLARTAPAGNCPDRLFSRA